MEFISLGKIEKGMVLLQGKYTYLTSRCFRYKHKKKNESRVKNCRHIMVYILRVVVIVMKCRQDKDLLGIFSKYYNKYGRIQDSLWEQ